MDPNFSGFTFGPFRSQDDQDELQEHQDSNQGEEAVLRVTPIPNFRLPSPVHGLQGLSSHRQEDEVDLEDAGSRSGPRGGEDEDADSGSSPNDGENESGSNSPESRSPSPSPKRKLRKRPAQSKKRSGSPRIPEQSPVKKGRGRSRKVVSKSPAVSPAPSLPSESPIFSRLDSNDSASNPSNSPALGGNALQRTRGRGPLTVRSKRLRNRNISKSHGKPVRAMRLGRRRRELTRATRTQRGRKTTRRGRGRRTSRGRNSTRVGRRGRRANLNWRNQIPISPPAIRRRS